MVDGVEIDRAEIPRLVFEHFRRGAMNRHGVGDHRCKAVQVPVAALIDTLEQGHEQSKDLAVELRGVHAQIGQAFPPVRRMYRSRRKWSEGKGHRLDTGEVVGHHHAVDRLRRVGRPPTDDDRLLSRLIQNVPDCLDFATEARDRPDAASIRRRFGEPEDSVFRRALAGRDRCPEHRAQGRIEGRDISASSFADQPGEVRHVSAGKQRIDDLPVRRIPANDEHTCCAIRHSPLDLRW
jgi:hypothetical protein